MLSLSPVPGFSCCLQKIVFRGARGGGTKHYPLPLCPVSQYLRLQDQFTGCQDLTLFLPQVFHKWVPPHWGQDPVLEIQPDHRGPYAPSPQALLALEGKRHSHNLETKLAQHQLLACPCCCLAKGSNQLCLIWHSWHTGPP